MPSLSLRSLRDIASEIERDWTPKVGGRAQPYVHAMKQMQSFNDRFCIDSARQVVTSFLNTADTWRGPVARRVKDELRAMLALHKKFKLRQYRRLQEAARFRF